MLDKKSLRFIRGKNTDWNELAKDCISFANSHGGDILIGVEDKDDMPPVGQRIDNKNVVDIIQKNIARRTINVGASITIETASNNAEYIRVRIARNPHTLASTTDGRFYIRIADECKPVMPDDFLRVAADKHALVWEELTATRVEKTNIDEKKKADFLTDVRNSPRISVFVREKSDDEILEYYKFVSDNYLTNLGILWIGTRNVRSSLQFAPVIQVIRYNEREEKVWKFLIDDHYLNPKEIVESVLRDIPDWQESMEIPDGAYRKNVPFFPIEVVRELISNALVHRTYTMQGDIFINIYTDRLEIHSPGLLPYGVTSKNILSKSVRRNENLCKVFYDLELMEREGSGYDMIYAKLLGTGKPLPVVHEGDDRVTVTVSKQFIDRETVKLMDKAANEYSLKQKEIITLGLIAQQQSYSAMELSKILNQEDEHGLRSWLGNLLEYGLIVKSGTGRGTQYAVNPEFIRKINFKGKTTLKNIEDYRLEELIYKDLTAYPGSSFSEIHKRIGDEINLSKVKRLIRMMLNKEILISEGIHKGTKYFIVQKMREKP